MNFNLKHKEFIFKRPSGTSRGVMTVKNSWFISLSLNTINATGEFSIIEGLSPDFENFEEYETKLKLVLSDLKSLKESNWSCSSIEDWFAKNQLYQKWQNEPSILFGIEMLVLDYLNGGNQIYFDNDFSRGKRNIPINGLVWMGDSEFMLSQIEEKIAQNFTCIKMKIGAIHFDEEIKLIRKIREQFDNSQIQLRVDANGSFKIEDAVSKLEALAELEVHSIEQPIAPKQWEAMAELCKANVLPIALDEELIGIVNRSEKIELLDLVKPHYIILKPSLHGGILGCKEWINLAEERKIDWWMTSALESNLGLNCICQFTAEYKNDKPHGLGTGGLYTNNIPSNLNIINGEIRLLKELSQLNTTI